uniref:Uncharacterized protein n=1 Tax=Leersia perrieri TaxID=77586 RepID=A0A0D9W3X0_9ORYZ
MVAFFMVVVVFAVVRWSRSIKWTDEVVIHYEPLSLAPKCADLDMKKLLYTLVLKLNGWLEMTRGSTGPM